MEVKELTSQKEAAAIGGNSWQRFIDWNTANGVKGSLSIPQEIASVYIPPRIFELTQNPDKVDILLTDDSAHKLGFIIFESMDEPITDKTVLDRWIENGERRPETRKSSYDDTWTPRGVDYMHARYSYLLGTGQLTAKDFIYMQHIMKVLSPSVVYNVNHFDRVEMRRLGIGTSFYDRLNDILKELGFKYNVGQLASPNPSFFNERRIRLDKLPKNLRGEFPESLWQMHRKFPNNPITVTIL